MAHLLSLYRILIKLSQLHALYFGATYTQHLPSDKILQNTGLSGTLAADYSNLWQIHIQWNAQ
jgi:hypothetical protein